MGPIPFGLQDNHHPCGLQGRPIGKAGVVVSHIVEKEVSTEQGALEVGNEEVPQVVLFSNGELD
jgi:hypothetical protein